MFEALSRSFPPLELSKLPESDRAFVESLPDEYRRFLLTRNGGFAEDFRYTFWTGVPFDTNPSRNDCVVEFYGVPVPGGVGEQPGDLLQLFVDHEHEHFLPSGVFAIARCIQNSLVCISTRDADRGAILYWDWYWRYPWCKDFFDARILAAKARFPNASEILANPAHAESDVFDDAINGAVLMPLAPSFSAWAALCEDKSAMDPAD